MSVSPPLNEHEREYLHRFQSSRRMHRRRGPYYAQPGNNFGQGAQLDGISDPELADVLNYNTPPDGQPGLWCQWVPTEDGSGIEWDGGEKFYHAAEWMQYLVDHFLKPGALAGCAPTLADPAFVHFTWDHVVNGEIEVAGELVDDRWLLIVRDNIVTTAHGRIVYE